MGTTTFMIFPGLLFLLWLNTSKGTESITSRLVAPRLQNANFLEARKRAKETQISTSLLDFIAYISNESPAHQFHIVYDQLYSGLDGLLKFSSDRWTECTVVNYRVDSDVLDHLFSVLTITEISRRHIFVVCSTRNIEQIFKMVAARNLENASIRWLVLGMDDEVEVLLQGLLREGSLVQLIRPKREDSFQLLSSEIRKDESVGFKEVGIWKSSPPRFEFQSGLSGPFPELDDIYSNFGGRELVVTANDNSPFFGLKEADDGLGFEPDSGIDISVMNAIGGALNFSYTVMKPADGKWGGPLPDGTITGMIGEVARRNAHVAICEITVTGSRESVIDFTWPYYLESLTIISPAPAEKSRAFAVFSPFTLNIWMYIAAATLAIGPLLTLETWFMKTCLKRDTRDFNLNNFAFNMFRSLVGQTNFLPARVWPHRFTFFFWYLFCFNVLVIYSGTLTAVLVTPAYEKPIDYLEDLPQAVGDGTTIGIVGDSSFENLFKEAKEGIYKETWKLFNHEDRSQSFFGYPDAGFNRILPNKLAFINPMLNSIIRATRRGYGKFHFSKQTFYPQGYGIVCFTGAPFKEKFSQMLTYMIEGGLIFKWAGEEVTKVAGKSPQEEAKSGPPAITLKHLQAAFFVLLIGFLVAAMTLILEYISSTVEPCFQSKTLRVL